MSAVSSSIKRIAIVGPECTGKTHLSMALAEHYRTAWVPEYARQYIDRLNRPYHQDDLTSIARGQLLLEDELALTANRLLICDTNLLVIKIWSEYKFGHLTDELKQLLHTHHYDLLLLMYVDIPWEEDPQREHPDKRDYFFSVYHQEVEASGTPYQIIRGSTEERLQAAIRHIDRLNQSSI
ncbi:MAG: ATP-binding protein [Cyclobacteriaceae bacterium]|nr:ATP-binding protein [Cyclobacteriaceae bacterium]